MGLLEDVAASWYGEASPATSNGYDYRSGYYRFGGEDPNTFELMATLAANELGLDNWRRAWNAGQRGDWGEALKEGAFGIIQPLSWFAGPASVALRGARAASLASRGAPSVLRGALPWARSLGPTAANVVSRGTAAMGRVPGAMRAAGGASKPFRATAAGVRGVLGPALRAAQRNPRLALPAAGLAASLAFVDRGENAESQRTGTISPQLTGGSVAPRSAAAARYQGLADRIKESGASTGGRSFRTLSEMQAAKGGSRRADEAARAAAEALVAGRQGTPASQAGASIASLNAQYDKAVANLRSQYQLAETDQERARLKFMLEDIEAQRAAGMEAISSLYAEKESKIRERAVKSRAGTIAEVARLGQSLGGVASDLEQRLAAQQIGMAEDLSGLGVGAAQMDPQNEWSQLAAAMVPIEQQYAQRMGDIGAEGIDWLADTTSLQGAAQQADLQRAAAFARSAGIANYQRQVSDRINSERAQMRDAELSLLMQNLSAQQSARELNARLAADLLAEGGPEAMQQFISDVSSSGQISPGQFAYMFASRFGRLPTPQEEEIYTDVYRQSASERAYDERMMGYEEELARQEVGAIPGVASIPGVPE